MLIIEGTQVELSLSERVRRKEHVDTPEETKARERYWKLPHYAGREYPGTPRYDYLATGILTLKASDGRPGAGTIRSARRSSGDSRRLFPASFFLQRKSARARRSRRERRSDGAWRRNATYRIVEQRKRERAWKPRRRSGSGHHAFVPYADAVEHAAKLKGELTVELLDWIGWAKAKADWLDPLIGVSDRILDAPEPEKPALW